MVAGSAGESYCKITGFLDDPCFLSVIAGGGTISFGAF
jgi:hypothetical protein